MVKIKDRTTRFVSFIDSAGYLGGSLSAFSVYVDGVLIFDKGKPVTPIFGEYGARRGTTPDGSAFILIKVPIGSLVAYTCNNGTAYDDSFGARYKVDGLEVLPGTDDEIRPFYDDTLKIQVFGTTLTESI